MSATRAADAASPRASRAGREPKVGEAQSLRDIESTAPAVVRAAALLELLGQVQEPLGLSELARRLDLPKSTVANLCSALEQSRLVRKVDGRYELGLRILELAAGYTSGDVISHFRQLAQDLRWASQETINLATLDGTDVVFLARHEGTQPIRLAPGIGRRQPATCNALGKAILSEMDPAELAVRYADRSAFQILTPHSISSIAELTEDIEATKARGYADDREENSIGLVCYSVPVPQSRPGGPLLAVAVALLVARESDDLREKLLADLRQLAADLARLA
jgi:IclR family transcriptional regulator, blcABC operon repressor